MILADTSVWTVSGELACGNLKSRATILSDLNALPAARAATHTEALHLLDTRRLYGRGLGWVDIHLLASGLLSNCRVWTFDKRLRTAAEELDLV